MRWLEHTHSYSPATKQKTEQDSPHGVLPERGRPGAWPGKKEDIEVASKVTFVLSSSSSPSSSRPPSSSSPAPAPPPFLAPRRHQKPQSTRHGNPRGPAERKMSAAFNTPTWDMVAWLDALPAPGHREDPFETFDTVNENRKRAQVHVGAFSWSLPFLFFPFFFFVAPQP